MALGFVRADGMDWPLPTFLDAYGYRRTDPFELPRIEGQVRLATVSHDGELCSTVYADQVRWHEVLAYRPIANGLESTPCRCCGEPVYRTDFADICADCEDYGELAW